MQYFGNVTYLTVEPPRDRFFWKNGDRTNLNLLGYEVDSKKTDAKNIFYRTLGHH